MNRKLSWISALAFGLGACSEARFGSGSGTPPFGTEPTPEPQEEPSADALPVPEEVPPPAEPAAVEPPPLIETPETCLNRGAGIEAVIDFEAPPNGVNRSITDELYLSHGVAFSVSGGFQPVVRATTRQRETELGVDEEAWMCIYCVGYPRRNRLADAAAERAVGRHVLSSTAAASETAGETLRIDYRVAVKSLSFDLIDVDGDEVWVVEAFDANGTILTDLTQSISRSGYLKSRTGNGTPTRIDVATKDQAAIIRGFLIRGDKPLQKFGFAFDNFDTGIPACGDN